MSNFFQKLFPKEDFVDHEKIKDQSTLSFLGAQLDKALLLKFVQGGNLPADSVAFVERSLAIQEHDTIALSTELQNLKAYLEFFKHANTEGFYSKLDIKGLDTANGALRIPVYLLFPLLQNAIYYGYNSMEKYPLRIRIHVYQDSLKLEVSNRVNHHIANQEISEELRWFKTRLNLLYKDEYTLLFNSNSSLFKVTLFVSLK